MYENISRYITNLTKERNLNIFLSVKRKEKDFAPVD